MGTSGRGPGIPPEAAGLFAAIEADRLGNPLPLRTWLRVGWPVLVSTLRSWAYGPRTAEGVADDVVFAVLCAVAAGRHVGDERAWIAAIARNRLRDGWREQERFFRLRRLLARDEVVTAKVRSAGPFSVRRSLAEAAMLLPTPYREAALLELVHE